MMYNPNGQNVQNNINPDSAKKQRPVSADNQQRVGTVRKDIVDSKRPVANANSPYRPVSPPSPQTVRNAYVDRNNPQSANPHENRQQTQKMPPAGNRPPVQNKTVNRQRIMFDEPLSSPQAEQPQKTQPQTGKQLPNQKKPGQMSRELMKSEKMRVAKRKMFFKNSGSIITIMVLVIGISLALATVAISCVNDLLVINISEKNDTHSSVVITDGMTTNDVIDALDEAGLVKNGWFCKLAAMFIGYSDDGYIPRTYALNRSMGLENMLNEIKNKSSKTAKTVFLTFPEGYNADQIIEMLEENGVCTRAKLIEAMNTVDFQEEFEFLSSMSNPESRYIKLEGYLFPDTYEFYLGESAESVIRKFLNNFDKKWTEEFAEDAQELRLTVDQVIKLASVVEKEAVGADMPVVGSILHNRLEVGMRLECDSTSAYISSNKSGLSADEVQNLNNLYDTYICDGMPVGAICNPGLDSIMAVLNSPETEYYYFIHDKNNEFHVAKTLAEQEYNIATYGLAE